MSKMGSILPKHVVHYYFFVIEIQVVQPCDTKWIYNISRNGLVPLLKLLLMAIVCKVRVGKRGRMKPQYFFTLLECTTSSSAQLCYNVCFMSSEYKTISAFTAAFSMIVFCFLATRLIENCEKDKGKSSSYKHTFL